MKISAFLTALGSTVSALTIFFVLQTLVSVPETTMKNGFTIFYPSTLAISLFLSNSVASWIRPNGSPLLQGGASALLLAALAISVARLYGKEFSVNITETSRILRYVLLLLCACLSGALGAWLGEKLNRPKLA